MTSQYRWVKVAAIIVTLILAYLFALNGRYEPFGSKEALLLDKWTRKCYYLDPNKIEFRTVEQDIEEAAQQPRKIRYIVASVKYDIPEDKVLGFEQQYPHAFIVYYDEGKSYKIRLSDRAAFLIKHPNATCYIE